MHPQQHNTAIEVYCESPVVDERNVTDSGGHTEKRFVIGTLLKLGQAQWPVELTLTNRDTMAFRMLLGRRAMEGRMIVQPDGSFLLGEPSPKDLSIPLPGDDAEGD